MARVRNAAEAYNRREGRPEMVRLYGNGANVPDLGRHVPMQLEGRRGDQSTPWWSITI